MPVVDLLLGLVAVVLLLPVVVLFAQVFLAWLPSKPSIGSVGRHSRLAVLIPAHNEAAVIEATLRTLLPQLQPGDRALVVADNCTDDTAALARAAGAEVVERTNLEQRGKGYALNFGVQHFAANPPEVLVIVDADCQVAAGALDLLAQKSALVGRPVQALYLMFAPVGAGLKLRIAEFAWLVKNQARPLGFHRIGLPCQLMGTGMAFPWQAIKSVDIASGHIVEDLKLGLDFCRLGKAPVFLPEAVVTSVFPSNEEGVRSQRTRWEHGHLGVILADAPKLLVESIKTLNGFLFFMTLDMLVPPLALLTLSIFAVLILSGMPWMLGGSIVPIGIALLSAILLGLAIFMAWFRYGRKVVSLPDLAYAPLYVILKIPLYIKFVFSRQVEWVRSNRDEK